MNDARSTNGKNCAPTVTPSWVASTVPGPRMFWLPVFLLVVHPPKPMSTPWSPTSFLIPLVLSVTQPANSG